DPVDEGGDVPGPAHVGGDRLGPAALGLDGRDGPAERLRGPPGDDHGGALPGEVPGDDPARACPAPGDQDDLVGEPHDQASLRCVSVRVAMAANAAVRRKAAPATPKASA